ncbi:hypothetical protein DFQ27_001372 [Actinomortierella ambigua]|uniref:Uncharacterized protein n=1 Tax=Actinomortierella ambigua TaxID=1343610 RepID=A0A9P6QF81_9FUNG|nr:hypothetical protein DFQ26_002043 [Actinomortierella ambigua]KAG0264188.1 hypothetical protein DFQ27_001372 [Actinomortierella ambigua]
MSKYFEKFFGCVAPRTGAVALSIFYTIVGFVFAILSFGRWIMPHAELDLSLPWAVVCLLLLATGLYGYWGVTRGSTWHKRQFVSCSWGFLLMFLCWAIVYIAVEDTHVDKVNTGCMDINPDWTLEECDSSRKRAATIATVMVTIGMLIGIYFTLVLSSWVSGIEWAEHLEAEKQLDDWRNGHGEQPHIKDPYAIHIEGEDKA